tara:strand:- start:8944 stop:9219 length:276 start_codon:yes stop_codon:yes gene_type:complete
MENIDNILRLAIKEANKTIKSALLEDINDDLNIFDHVDSMSIVNILLESESLLVEKLDKQISIVDETMFDATSSPLKKWSTWVKHVADLYS